MMSLSCPFLLPSGTWPFTVYVMSLHDFGRINETTWTDGRTLGEPVGGHGDEKQVPHLGGRVTVA